MKGIIVSFRRSRHTIKGNHLIIEVEGVEDKEAAAKLVGKKVVYNTGKKEMTGEVKAAHGNSGAIRAIFESGMPGQSIGAQVSIN